jgi:5-methylcytosine-specific restriction endonuclease McrA
VTLRAIDTGRGLRSAGGSGLRSSSAASGGAEASWRKWYKLQRWVNLRKAVLLRDLYTCARCGAIGSPTVARGGDLGKVLIANHKRPHRGDEALFWDEANLETVCKPCHDGAVARDEIRRRMR